MSCGPSEALKKVADKIEAGNSAIDSKINAIAGGAIGGIRSVLQGAVNGVKGAVKGAIPEIDLPNVPDSLQNDVTDLVKKLAVSRLAYLDIKNDLKNLETKWGSLDFGDIDLNNLPTLLRSGALDLETICKKIPNFEKEGVDVIVKGLPITFPNTNASSIIRGGNIPKIPEPIIKVDVARAKREAGEKFVNVVKPRFFGG